MPYTLPTPTDLKTLYPAFTDAPDATVTANINMAALMVDTSWLESDYQAGIVNLAAHYMASEGIGTSSDAKAVAAGGWSQIRSGSLSLSRGSTSGQVGDGSVYGSTVYGRRYLTLLRANKGGPRVTATAAWPYSPDAYDWPAGYLD